MLCEELSAPSYAYILLQTFKQECLSDRALIAQWTRQLSIVVKTSLQSVEHLVNMYMHAVEALYCPIYLSMPTVYRSTESTRFD